LRFAVAKPQPGRTEGPIMRNSIEIENIEEMRHSEGIDDVELRAEIRVLGIGDFVRLTLLNRAASFAGETLMVRITSMKGSTIRGKLVDSPTFVGLSMLRVGSPVSFTTAQIHSVAKRQSRHQEK
jgi:hypothetical protein